MAFAAQWRALSGKDSAYWTARNAGYDRIEKIERGKGALEVKVTFNRTYADWKSLFAPLYPKDVMGTPDLERRGPQEAEGHRRPVQGEEGRPRGRRGHPHPQRPLVGRTGPALHDRAARGAP
ncbi:hypothetical protein SHIRM173S_02933 [Streptomyces hirsutus]